MTPAQGGQMESNILQTSEARVDWLQEHRPEVDRAQGRIGETPIDTIKWLLDRFHERDLSGLSIGGQLDLKWELWVFAFGARPPLAGRPLPLPDSMNLKEFQKIVTKALDHLLAGKVLTFSYGSFEEVLGVVPGYGPVLIQKFGDDKDQHQHRIIETLKPYADSLKRCAACNRVFPQRQENQAYCSFRCQNRVAAAEFRKRTQYGKKSKRATKRGKRK
jgi:hypothetical protein